MINEKWIWVNRQDGKKEKIAPWEIADQLDSNPIISLAAPRPDFNGSLIQFLIGLVQTTMSPRNERDWRKYFINPPKTDELRFVFEEVSDAFNLDGENERFMQDYEHFESTVKDRTSVSQMLMEMPGKKTIEDNTDHFLKRDTVSKMCFSCCATALFTLQTNAPKGGSGHLTSLRGGGPLTTIVLGDNLWQTVWLNVIPDENFDSLGANDIIDLGYVFPWMVPTRTKGKKGLFTSPMDVSPKQMYWGMPRRIRLDLNNCTEGICDICGKIEDLVFTYSTQTYGNDYTSQWRHVLTPYYEKKNDLIPRKTKPEDVFYRHWLGLVKTDPDKGSHPSLCLEKFISKQSNLKNLGQIFQNSPRLWAFGYHVIDMKVECWYESRMPLFNVDEQIRNNYESQVSKLIKVAEIVDNNTRNCIKQALYGKKSIRGDISFIDSRFWHDTESEFYNVLNKLNSELESNSETVDLKIQWVRFLSKVSERLFDEYSQSMQFSVVEPERVAIAHRDLRRYNSEGGKKIKEILGLPT